jgi:thymidylate synthase ThyX
MTISAKIIADSISLEGIRLVTVQCRYPKFIHGEVMTHRVFSRNASSSRAIPVERLIKDVLDDPVIPMHWGKNQPGMQANEECNEKVWSLDHCDLDNSSVIENWNGLNGNGQYYQVSREDAWLAARNLAIDAALHFKESGYHKQIVNRLLEPFCHINTLITSTEWSNFFALRCHPDAQPEMQMLADAIFSAMADHDPTPLKSNEWHTPYISKNEDVGDFPITDHDFINDYYFSRAVRISVARCARVSYLTQEGKTPNIEDDLKLYSRLVGSKPLHASPAEHQARPDTGKFVSGVVDRQITDMTPKCWNNWHLHGNLRGYIQYRKTLPGECQ